jgi:S1-C subfamily serine protease
MNVNGELVGINTFILRTRAAARGWALRSRVRWFRWHPKLRRYGHLHRGEIGIQLQTITRHWQADSAWRRTGAR